jgi:hypothetical protein
LDALFLNTAALRRKVSMSPIFPLSAKLGASIGATRSLTTGLRDNTLAFDLLHGL